MPIKKNKYDLSGKWGVGYDEDSNVFYFDLNEYSRIKNYYWSVRPNYYVHGSVKGKVVFLHRYLLNVKKGLEVDHINHIRYDCRKINMRVCTRQQNACNHQKQKNNTSQYKGVSFHKRDKKWRARIKVNKKTIELGYFLTAKEAFEKYKKAAEKYHKEFKCIK